MLSYYNKIKLKIFLQKLLTFKKNYGIIILPLRRGFFCVRIFSSLREIKERRYGVGQIKIQEVQPSES